MRFTLFRRSESIIKSLIFLILSLVFLQIITSLDRGVSAFQWNSFSELLIQNKSLLVLFGLSFISVFKAWRMSKVLLILFITLVAYKGIALYFVPSNSLTKPIKMILALDFIYVAAGFYFNFAWWVELGESIYRPGFHINHIGKKSEYDFPIQVINKNGEQVEGLLTNWGETGCFVSINGSSDILRGRVSVMIECFGRKFLHEGRVMTGYADGIGIKFENISEREVQHSWFDFYDILNDRGYTPRYARA